jgi:hypothetical protein
LSYNIIRILRKSGYILENIELELNANDSANDSEPIEVNLNAPEHQGTRFGGSASERRKSARNARALASKVRIKSGIEKRNKLSNL